MLKNILAFLVLISLGSIVAQTYLPNYSSTKLEVKKSKKEQQNINILAVMVEFKKDDFSLTKGDGSFGSIYSKDYGNTIIDPLPHDQFYFSDHLEFAKNYFTKVSNGNVEINYSVQPNIIEVSKLMRDYSPLSGESFNKLGDFSKEVWTIFDQENPSFNYSQYNLFVIFHAGVGKDISTSNLLGEARDLPSLYLGLNTLKEFYGDSFEGIQVSDGSLIKNSIILPETESREEDRIGGVQLLELSINGLIVSSIASHLGLPDLFDSETGKSAIGRFGLMDGQSLFAYAGLFPPEPSAWEKIYLGWETPKVVNSNTQNIEISAEKIVYSNSEKIIKVPINSSEYYLIENRSRDVKKNGAIINYKLNGQLRTIEFGEDLDNFNNAIVDTLKGVVVDVDEFDWALPGSGILIWHIDENIINNNISENKINVGLNRGVDLEEADGIQDIGEEFNTIFGDKIIAEGDEHDLWFNGNTSKFYQNNFGVNTKPNTNANNGSNSLISISHFSEISNNMNFDVSFSNENIGLVENYSIDSTLAIVALKAFSNIDYFYFNANNDLYIIGSDTTIIDEFSNNNIALVENKFNPIVFGAFESKLNILKFTDNGFSNKSISVSSNISAPVLVSKHNETDYEIVLGLANGNIEIYNYNIESNEDPSLVKSIESFNSGIRQIALLDKELFVISENNYSDNLGNKFQLNSNIIKIAITKDKLGNYISIILTDDNSIYSHRIGNDRPELLYRAIDEIYNFSLADLKNDGENYIVFNESSKVNAINLAGSMAEHFPFILDVENRFLSIPLIADINNDKKLDIIATTSKGNVYAISGNDGKVINGFPLTIGNNFSGIHSLVNTENDLKLSVLSDENELYLWKITSVGKVNWGSEYGNDLNHASLDVASDQNYISTYFPKNRTYNYPNPVYENETFIRTYVSEDSKVEVKIFDLAGDLVDEFEFNATGGLDNEYAWNVSNVQSGAYLARVEVKSNSGKSESKIIKIAVIK